MNLYRPNLFYLFISMNLYRPNKEKHTQNKIGLYIKVQFKQISLQVSPTHIIKKCLTIVSESLNYCLIYFYNAPYAL